MNIQGKLHRITNVSAFVASYVKTGGKPTTGFAPWGKARVHLGTDFPGGEFAGGFIPPMSLKVDTNSQGGFNISVPEALAKSRARVVAYNIGSVPNPLPGLPPLPVLDPIYRSQPFRLSDVSAAEQAQVQNIFVFPAKTPTEAGVSQEELNAELKDLKKAQKLDKLRATIGSHHISVAAEKSGGDLTFRAHVRGSTSHDLERVIEIKAGEIDIDLPGPDFIVGLCVDEDEIEASIRKGLSKMSAKVSKTLLNELDKQFPGIASQATVSVWRTRHVQIGDRIIKFPGLPDVHTPVFAVVPDGALGVPRKLY
jgi:hypothetical protein